MLVQTSMNPKTTIRVATKTWEKPVFYEVEAETVGRGVWAVHRQLVSKERGQVVYGENWDIVHVPTGAFVFQNIRQKWDAVGIAKTLVAFGWERADSADRDESYKALVGLMGKKNLHSFIAEVRRRISGRLSLGGASWVTPFSPWKPTKGSKAARAAKKAPPRKAVAASSTAAKKAPKAKAPASRGQGPARSRGKAPPMDLLKLARDARKKRQRNPSPLTHPQDSAKRRCLW